MQEIINFNEIFLVLKLAIDKIVGQVEVFREYLATNASKGVVRGVIANAVWNAFLKMVTIGKELF